MIYDEALQIALDELADVQFCDNTWQEADRARTEVKEIMRALVERLTPRAPDLGQAAANPSNDDVAPSG